MHYHLLVDSKAPFVATKLPASAINNCNKYRVVLLEALKDIPPKTVLIYYPQYMHVCISPVGLRMINDGS